MSWGWNEIYDYDYEDTPEYMQQLHRTYGSRSAAASN